MANLSKTFSDSNEFLKICKYKWAFNIKPDIVIHTDRDTAICIETKYESGESQYPASQAEKIIFTELKLPYIKQMQLQKYMMEDLLGIDTTFVFIGKNVRKNDDYTFMHWEEVFEDMDMADMHQSVRQMASNPKLIS